MDRGTIDRWARRLAEQQHGVLARRQLTQLGMTRAMLRHRVDRGLYEWASSRVLRVVGAPITASQHAMTATLHAPQPAFLSHWSAADIWGLPGFETAPIHVTSAGRPGYRAASFSLTLHKPRLVGEHHRTRLDGLAIATPTRTLFDLAGHPAVHPKRLERALDTSLSRNLVCPSSLQVMLDELAVRGRSGIRLMRELIAERTNGEYRPPESGLESRFRELLRGNGFPEFRRQVHVGDGEAWIGRVDFVHPDVPIVVEIDGATFHGSLTDQRFDLARRAKLTADGWDVIAVTGSDLFHRPDAVVSRLRRALLATRQSA